jgi:hypothetical protein
VANKVVLDDSYPARQGQEWQGGPISDTNIQPQQGMQGIEEVIRSIQRANQLLAPSYAPSGGAHFTGGVNVLHGTPGVPVTMEIAARTGNGGYPKRHYHLGLQAASDLSRLVQPGQPPESSTEVGGAAYSSSFYGFCPSTGPWAATVDLSASRPVAQAVAPQMNTVTPYASSGHDEGGTPVGAVICSAASTAGPTPKTTGACGPASIMGRKDARRCHRGPHRAMGYVGCDQTNLKVPARRATRPSLSRATRGPAVQFEADANALGTRLLNEGADNTAVELLCTQVFNNEVSAKALTVKSMYIEQSSGTSSMRSKYRLLLGDVEMVDGSTGHCCLLCPQGRRKEYKNPQDSIRHFLKAHFGIAASCIGGWYVAVS